MNTPAVISFHSLGGSTNPQAPVLKTSNKRYQLFETQSVIKHRNLQSTACVRLVAQAITMKTLIPQHLIPSSKHKIHFLAWGFDSKCAWHEIRACNRSMTISLPNQIHSLAIRPTQAEILYEIHSTLYRLYETYSILPRLCTESIKYCSNFVPNPFNTATLCNHSAEHCWELAQFKVTAI